MTYTQYSTINSANSPLLDPYIVFKEYLAGIYFITNSQVLVNFHKDGSDMPIADKGILVIKIMAKGLVDTLSSDTSQMMHTLNYSPNWEQIMSKDNPLYVGDDILKGYYVHYEYTTVTGDIYRWDFSVWSMFADGITSNAVSAGVSESDNNYRKTLSGDTYTQWLSVSKRYNNKSGIENMYTFTEANNKFVKINDPRVADWQIIRSFSTKVFFNDQDNSLTCTDTNSSFFYKATDGSNPPYSPNYNFYLSDGRPSDELDKTHMPKPNIALTNSDLNAYRNSFYFNRNGNQLNSSGGRLNDFVYTLSHYESDSLGNSANDIYTGVKVHYPARVTFNGTAGQTTNTVIIHRPFARNQVSKSITLEPITRLVTAQYCEHILERQRYLISLLTEHTVRNVRLSSTLTYANGGGAWNSFNNSALVTGFGLTAQPATMPLTSGHYIVRTNQGYVHSRVVQYYRNNGWREIGT